MGADKSIWWPSVENRPKAKDTARQGAWAAVFVSVATAIGATVALLSDEEIEGISAWAYVDALLFGAIAVGIFRLSRFAAAAGLALYLFERFVFGFQLRGLLIAMVVTLAFVNGIRGTFTYHELTEKMNQSAGAAPTPSQ